LVQSNERARLQLLFSHHGISLSAIPFLSDAAGGCVKSLKDRQQIWQFQGGIPVFSCDVMQDLVLRPGAFFDPAYEKAMRGGASAGAPAPAMPPTGGYGDDVSPGAYSQPGYVPSGSQTGYGQPGNTGVYGQPQVDAYGMPSQAYGAPSQGYGSPPPPPTMPSTVVTAPRNLVDRVERRARN
jgi:hypothetical protein